jgi:lipoprotein-releasing system permease protein
LRLPYELFLALRYLRFHRGRTFLSVITLISVAGVAVGTAALVIALSMMAGMVQDVRERIHSGGAHLTVLDADAEVFSGGEPLVRRLDAVRGVEAAAPVLFTPALLTASETSEHALAELQGVDGAAHVRVILGVEAGEASPFSGLIRGAPSGREGIVLGKGLAQKLGVAEGDLVRAQVPRLTLTPWSALPRTQVFEVVGRYSSEHFQEDTLRAYVELESARRLQQAEGVSSWIEVRIEDLSRLEEMKTVLRAELGSEWHVLDLIEQNQDLIKALRTERLILFLAIGLIVVVAALNIVSTLILMVTDKIREIGTLGALGARPLEIARIFMLQGSLIGLVGTTTGLAVGSLACYGLDRYELIRLNPEVYYLDHIPFRLQPFDLASVAAAVLFVSFAATWYPALKAARLDPVEALRYE